MLDQFVTTRRKEVDEVLVAKDNMVVLWLYAEGGYRVNYLPRNT